MNIENCKTHSDLQKEVLRVIDQNTNVPGSQFYIAYNIGVYTGFCSGRGWPIDNNFLSSIEKTIEKK